MRLSLLLLDTRLQREVERLSVPLTLTYAALCPESECGTLFDLRDGACPTCGGRQWLSVSRILNREVTKSTLPCCPSIADGRSIHSSSCPIMAS